MTDEDDGCYDLRLMLVELGVSVEFRGRLAIVHLPELGEQVVCMKNTKLRRWCINRIKSRRHHVGRGLVYLRGGGIEDRVVNASKIT